MKQVLSHVLLINHLGSKGINKSSAINLLPLKGNMMQTKEEGRFLCKYATDRPLGKQTPDLPRGNSLTMECFQHNVHLLLGLVMVNKAKSFDLWGTVSWIIQRQKDIS